MRMRALLLAIVIGAAALAGCGRDTDGEAPASAEAGGRPIDAVLVPTRHLQAGDLEALARDSVPPALHTRLDTAWREGRSRWPLEELPLQEQLPRLIAALSAPDAERTLMTGFERQFSGAEGELRRAIETLGAFGVQYIQGDPDLDESERERQIQLLVAVSRWAADAPLADPARARRALAQLCEAARETGLDSDAAFQAAGMAESLRRMSAFLAVAKSVLADYGLDLDASLAGIEVRLERQTGDRAELRMRYPVGNGEVDARLGVERRDRRWYRSDWLRHAEAAASRPAAPDAD